MSTEPKPTSQPAPAPAAAGDSSGPSQEDRNLAVFAHIGGIVSGFVAPLVIWKVKGEQSAYVADHAKEALNFQITLHVGDFLAFLLAVTFGSIALLIWVPVMVVRLGLGLMGTMAASEGKPFRYVLNLRLIK